MGRTAITSAEMRALFPIGSKVHYSAFGLDVLRPTNRTRIGTVEGYAIGGSGKTVCAVRIRWPARKTLEMLHRDFVRLTTESKPPSASE
jgi:hypothetical protein